MGVREGGEFVEKRVPPSNQPELAPCVCVCVCVLLRCQWVDRHQLVQTRPKLLYLSEFHLIQYSSAWCKNTKASVKLLLLNYKKQKMGTYCTVLRFQPFAPGTTVVGGGRVNILLGVTVLHG